MKKTFIGITVCYIFLLAVQPRLYSSDRQITKPDINNYVNTLPAIADKLQCINDIKPSHYSLDSYHLQQIVKQNGFNSWTEFVAVHDYIMKSVAYLKMKMAIKALKHKLATAAGPSKDLLNKCLVNTEKQAQEIKKELDHNILATIKPHADKISKIISQKQ